MNIIPLSPFKYPRVVLSLLLPALSLVFLLGFVALPTSSFAQCDPANDDLGGTIWRDFNSNGLFDSTESWYDGIIVTAYDNDGTAYTATISTNGTYSFPGIFASQTHVRLEFSGLPSFLESGVQGADNGTAVQIHTAPSCDANFGVQNPATVCVDTNPVLVTTCFVQTHVAGWETEPAIVMVSDYPASSTKTTLADFQTVGSLVGTSHAPETDDLFFAAFQKRHVDMGPGGNDAIYRIDDTGAVTQFLNLDDGFGVDSAGPYSHSSPANIQWDAPAFDAVGKVAWGDIDLSEDGQFLWAVNLFDRKLYKIPVGTAADPTTPVDYTVGDPRLASIQSFPIVGSGGIPDAQLGLNPDANIRPFALKYYDGLLYVGMVNSAQYDAAGNLGGTTAADLMAYVYTFDPVLNQWSTGPVTSTPLDYPRDIKHGANGGLTANWTPWVGDWSQLDFSTDAIIAGNTQPWLTDIEFDTNGDMILGFRDRTADQLGVNNYDTSGTDTTWYGAISGGEILRAEQTGTASWLVETITVISDEYYSGENFGAHRETAQGGLAVIPGTVFTTAMDPLRFDSGGIIALDQTSGLKTQSIELYGPEPGIPGGLLLNKAQGLGDLEALCDEAPLEIGNYVWLDQDMDGIQDPCEPPLAGVPVSLYVDDGAGCCSLVTSTATDADGQYYFPDLSPTTTYHVVLGEGGAWDPATAELTVGTGTYALTTADQIAPGGAMSDMVDSDANLSTNACCADGYPTISVTTGGPGENNHTLDFGFIPPGGVEFDLALTKTDATPSVSVTFTIMVTNQGTNVEQDVTNVMVTELPPLGWTLSDPNWPGGVYTIPFLAAGSSTQITMTLTAPDSILEGSYTNYAEVTSFEDTEGNPAMDVDSNPDLGPFGDPGEVDGATDDPGDHDDLDPGVVAICRRPKCLGGSLAVQ